MKLIFQNGKNILSWEFWNHVPSNFLELLYESRRRVRLFFFCINNVSMIYFAIFVVRVAASCSFAKWKDEHKILGFDKNEQKWQSRYNPVCESLTHTTFNLFFFWNGTWFFQSLCCFGRHRWLDNTSSITNKLILAILMFFLV